MTANASDTAKPNGETEITYRGYIGEGDLPAIMGLVDTELSEPYVIYTYRYFLHQWYASIITKIKLNDGFNVNA